MKIYMICDCENFEQDKAAFFITLFVYVSGDLRIWGYHRKYGEDSIQFSAWNRRSHT